MQLTDAFVIVTFENRDDKVMKGEAECTPLSAGTRDFLVAVFQ